MTSTAGSARRSAVPAAEGMGDQRPAAEGRGAEQEGRRRGDGGGLRAGDAQQSDERGPQGAESNRPGMADAGDDDGIQGRDAEPDQQRRDDRDGHAETADPLQERSENPAEEQDPQDRVFGEALEPVGDAGQGAGLQDDQVKQQRRPDDIDHIESEHERAQMGVGE